MQISASSPSATPLSLSVTCPQGGQSVVGSSNIAVVMPETNGPCEATLKETLVQYDAVHYTLTIGPDGG
jgi:hypothetical protein